MLEPIVLHLNPSFHAGTQRFVLEPYCFGLEPIARIPSFRARTQPFAPEPNVLHLQEADMGPATQGFVHSAQLHSQLQAIQPTSQHNSSQLVALQEEPQILTPPHSDASPPPPPRGLRPYRSTLQTPKGDKQPLCALGRATGQPHMSHPHQANVTISSTFARRAAADRIEWIYPKNKHLVVV